MNIAAGENAAGGELSDKLFLDLLREVANRDRLFSKGKIDGVQIALGVTGLMPDTEDRADIESTVLEFNAVRLRYKPSLPNLSQDTRQQSREHSEVEYELGKTATLDYITLPSDIAVFAFDDSITSHVATEQRSFKREVKEHFRISTTNRILRACQCVEYYDENDEPIYGGCPWKEEADKDASIDQKTSEWLTSIGIANTTDTVNGDINMDFARSFEEEQHDKDLQAAMSLLNEFQRQLLIIAGVELPKQ